MKTILVTGGAGYIGSHTVVLLQQKGYQVIVADNFSNSSRDVIDNIEKITKIRPIVEEADLADADACEKIFEKHKIDAVIHFASYKYVNESIHKSLEYYKNNLYSTINVLEQMKRHNVHYFVFSSSCTVYGTPQKLPVTEQSPVYPALCPYGNTKQIIEEILKDTCVASPDLNVVSLRYFNPIGAHPSILIGETPSGVPQNLIPYLTQTAIGQRECLSVYGNDYNTPDGSCIRDYIHVADLAEAHIAAIEYMFSPPQKAQYSVFNVGTGKGHSVLELISRFEEVTGVKVNYKITERRSGDVAEIWADTSLVNHVLHWKAKYSLDDMLLTAWEWEKALKNNEKV